MSTAEYPKLYLYRRIVQAKLFIDLQYTSSLDVDNIADEACFSKFHFLRLFKSIYGKTPHQYLTHVRIQKAKELLRSGKSVTDTCYAVGFESQGSFSSLFKRNTGITAAAFSAMHISLNTKIATAPLEFVPGCFASEHGFLEK